MNLRLLLVEDHEDTSRLLARILQSEGHTVERARDIRTAIQHVESSAFDLVISDLGLPDGNGLDLMRRIRTLHPHIDGICLSGYGLECDLQASQDAGFREHLQKPVDLLQLRAAIERASLHRSTQQI